MEGRERNSTKPERMLRRDTSKPTFGHKVFSLPPNPGLYHKNSDIIQNFGHYRKFLENRRRRVGGGIAALVLGCLLFEFCDRNLNEQSFFEMRHGGPGKLELRNLTVSVWK